MKTINILGIKHTIEEIEQNFDCGGVHFGEIDYKQCKITINKDQTEEMKRQTICHEVTHAILMHLGFDEQCNDEHFVQAFAAAINQTFTPKIKEE